ncbi:MAG: threonine/serine dehydratase [Spirochaetaceae bacterium]|nr:MAG: threonine/serine dehydratase [Spirochaetaceae bacterium]
MHAPLLTRSDIEATQRRINQHVHRTPVLRSGTIDGMIGAAVLFKCENLQKVGAFKIRGALNAAACMSPEERRRGLATHSSGNHGQAVALAARLAAVPAFIVMPRSAPRIKRAAVDGYGATVIECGTAIQDRESTMRAVLAEVGAAFIHPYDDERVIAGQATVAMELFEDDEGLDALLAPIGGGGLMSGSCLATRAFSPRTVLYGCEPAGANDAARSLAAGTLLQNAEVSTIADGLRTNLSARTFAILQRHLSDIITVSDAEIIAAMRLIFERLKVVVEPSAAVPFAALMQQRRRFAGKRVGIILSGGNIDLEQPYFTRPPSG